MSVLVVQIKVDAVLFDDEYFRPKPHHGEDFISGQSLEGFFKPLHGAIYNLNGRENARCGCTFAPWQPPTSFLLKIYASGMENACCSKD